MKILDFQTKYCHLPRNITVILSEIHGTNYPMVDILLLEYSIDAYKKVLVKRVRVHPCWVTADYYIANLTTYRLCHPYAYIDTQICPIVLTVFPEQPHSYGHCSRWHLFGPLEGTLAYSHNGRVTLIQFSM